MGCSNSRYACYYFNIYIPSSAGKSTSIGRRIRFSRRLPKGRRFCKSDIYFTSIKRFTRPPGGVFRQDWYRVYVRAIRVPFSNSRKSLKGVQKPYKKQLSLWKGSKFTKVKNRLPQRVVNSWNLDKNLEILAQILGRKNVKKWEKFSKFSLSKGRFSNFGSDIPVISQT